MINKLLRNIVLFFILISCSKSNKHLIVVENFQEDIEQAQVDIVSSLSGNQNIQPINISLKARATCKERSLARHYLINLLEALSINPIEQNYRLPNSNPLTDLLIGPFTGTNIYGILPASKDTNDYIVLGAHYDTERDSPGANDNASAIALLYGVVKKLSELKKRKVHVVLVFFDQEEEGLIGSKVFANFLKEKKMQIHSVHTFDQIGWDKDEDKAIELELPTEELKKLYQKQALKLKIPIYTTKVNSTDHHSFRSLGFHSVGITEEYVNNDTTPFKHTENDTFETVNFEYLTSITELVYEVIAETITENH